MMVAYPKKLLNTYTARDILRQVVLDREIHLITLNRYRYSEQRSCKDLTNLIEQLNGQPPQLIKDLSRHVADEARHAMWLTDLLVDLESPVNTPPGVSYIQEFERLLDAHQPGSDEFLINTLAAINVTEKRGCEYFSAHLYALKQAPQTPENQAIAAVLGKILPEEAAHVRWGNRWLAELARKSPEHRQNVELAKRRYAAIEQAAFESGLDITLGAELRRVSHLLDIAETMPILNRVSYLAERLPQTLLSPDLQFTRIQAAQRAWKRNPQAFMDKFIPMFINGIQGNKPAKTTPNSAISELNAAEES